MRLWQNVVGSSRVVSTIDCGHNNGCLDVVDSLMHRVDSKKSSHFFVAIFVLVCCDVFYEVGAQLIHPQHFGERNSVSDKVLTDESYEYIFLCVD